MRNYAKEIAIGAVPVLLLFLLYIGYNIVPLLLLGGLATVLAVAIRSRGMAGLGIRTGGRHSETRRTPPPIGFDEIGGQERAKRELQESLEFLIKHEEIRRFGIRPLKGILLEGPPGTGKTLLAKASAHYTDSVFVSASGSEFVEMYVGVGASRVRELFKEAREAAAKQGKSSAVIFIDEIDAIGGKRSGGQNREYDQTLNQLLTEMDGLHPNETPRILVIAATNRKEMLDPALLRPGRFDRHIAVDLPDKAARLHILRLHAKNKPLADEADLEQVASETFGFSGAQLESVMNEAAIYMLREGADKIRPEHLNMAIDKVMMGEQTDRQSTQEERERVAIHELGHAIMAELARPGSVSQVALRPRGQALGYVRHSPAQDHYLYTKRYIEQQIMIALGGAAAEELFYGGRSTGSRNDFEQATDLVGMMIESGLTGLGIVKRDFVTKEEWSKENNAILEQLMEETRRTLDARRDVFKHALDKLIREEVLSGDRFRELLRESGDGAA
ncbi:AAA family ATPase [Paenibacillus thermoaerophilus]|uniref:AAA family ATPase n=1 Tax=Paenibacillus thermoaerophilus TaxID=1215385 RepID=A0ABW2V2W0_9BACL|nr:AAA family ATPase [Paenibacillus thermoaerophilus]TMV18870.1 AAA family ATPase [Paenibacillus thermoaerophilus]